jgi:hypothetical protein
MRSFRKAAIFFGCDGKKSVGLRKVRPSPQGLDRDSRKGTFIERLGKAARGVLNIALEEADTKKSAPSVRSIFIDS